MQGVGAAGLLGVGGRQGAGSGVCACMVQPRVCVATWPLMG